MMKNIGVAVLGALALVAAPLLSAHAQVPTTAEWATQVASSTGQATGYVSNTIFSGGGLLFLIVMLAFGVLIGLIFMGFRAVSKRKKI